MIRQASRPMPVSYSPKSLNFFILAFLTVTWMIVFSPQFAFALNLEEAKAQGLVGEMPSGYLGAVEEPVSSAVQALVNDINSQRREKYASIAQNRGTALAAVEALAGKTAIDKSKPGHFVQVDGKWKRK